MSEQDPTPFGYTFHDFFDSAPPARDSDGGAPSLLTETENQSLADFFSNTDPFHLVDPDLLSAPADADTKPAGAAADFSVWSSYVPATVHRVSTTVLDHGFPQSASASTALEPTPDDLLAASTLYHNAQLPHPDARQGSDRLDAAAFLPNHLNHHNLDAQLPPQWSMNSMRQARGSAFGPPLNSTDIRRSYAFGTDTSFDNPAGYVMPQEHGQIEERSQPRNGHAIHRASGRGVIATATAAYSSPKPPELSSAYPNEFVNEEPSEEGTSDEDSETRPTKKRKTTKHRMNKKGAQKVARNRIDRDVQDSSEASKKKRSSVAAQKLQRENLTEEQKRNNHILSEQKRRNLIKRGFDDLHALVPEIRNGGLSKSSVLTEAASFLEKLIRDNQRYAELTRSAST